MDIVSILHFRIADCAFNLWPERCWNRFSLSALVVDLGLNALWIFFFKSFCSFLRFYVVYPTIFVIWLRLILIVLDGGVNLLLNNGSSVLVFGSLCDLSCHRFCSSQGYQERTHGYWVISRLLFPSLSLRKMHLVVYFWELKSFLNSQSVVIPFEQQADCQHFCKMYRRMPLAPFYQLLVLPLLLLNFLACLCDPTLNNSDIFCLLLSYNLIHYSIREVGKYLLCCLCYVLYSFTLLQRFIIV